MKIMERISVVTMAVLGAATPVLAAAEREDNSGLVVWGFIAFCALIVVGQLFPLLRNLRSAKKEASLAELDKARSEH